MEDGDRARRDPDADVGEIWDSESLKDLEKRRRKHPSVRVWGWGKSRIAATARCIVEYSVAGRDNSPHYQTAVLVSLEP